MKVIIMSKNRRKIVEMDIENTKISKKVLTKNKMGLIIKLVNIKSNFFNYQLNQNVIKTYFNLLKSKNLIWFKYLRS